MASSSLVSNDDVSFEFTKLSHDLQHMVAMKLDLSSFSTLRMCSKATKSLCEECENCGYLPLFDFEYSNFYDEKPVEKHNKLNGGWVSRPSMFVSTELVVSRVNGKVVWNNGGDRFREHILRYRFMRVFDIVCVDAQKCEDLKKRDVDTDWDNVCYNRDGFTVCCHKHCWNPKSFNNFLERHKVNELCVFVTEAVPGMDVLLRLPAVTKLSSVEWFVRQREIGKVPMSVSLGDLALSLRAPTIKLPSCDFEYVHVLLREWLEGRREMKRSEFGKVLGISYTTFDNCIAQLETGILSQFSAVSAHEQWRSEDEVCFQFQLIRPSRGGLWANFFITSTECRLEITSLSF